MNLDEHALTYPWDDQLPALGECQEVAPGVYWIRMGLPFVLDHINLWLLRDCFQGREGWTVVDCGIDHARTRQAWEALFSGPMQGLPVVRVIATHMHPDHLGLAHWLCRRFDAPLWISATDFYAALAHCKLSPLLRTENAVEFYSAHGATDPEFLAHVQGRSAYYPHLVPEVPTSFQRLQDGDTLVIGGQSWRTIAGYGHAPEHMALFNAQQQLLISGDMVLPRISSNVSVFSNEPEGNPLEAFLTSLERYRPLPASTLVLPSHGKPFRGLHTRLDQLRRHHEGQLDRVRQACCANHCSAADLVPTLFERTLDAHQTTFAMGEALAHLHYLWHRGLLARERSKDGVWRFRSAVPCAQPRPPLQRAA